MAGGYLGKISAVVAANTGDYVRGLNEGAKATRNFAKDVQSTLTRSARDAAKAFEGIYTPLQQVERALRQAGQLRLNFGGFQNAVKNISDLQKRLNDVLTKSEIDLIVRTSGLRDIEAVRSAINSLSEKEISLTANAGGLSGLVKERARLQASGEATTSILNTKATQEELDALIAKLNVLDDRKIELIIDVVNQRGLDEAITRSRRLSEAADQIARPFNEAVASFSKLGGSVQAAFSPALGRVQRQVELLGAAFRSGGDVSRQTFNAVQANAQAAAAAIERLVEAQRQVGGLSSGNTLKFTSPRQFDLLGRAGAIQSRVDSLSGRDIEGFGIGSQQAAVRRQAESLQRLLASRESIVLRDSRADTSGIDNAIARSTAALERQIDAYERLTAAAERYKATAADRESVGLATSAFEGESLTDRFRRIEAERARQRQVEQDREDQSRRASAASAFLPPVLQRESDAISDPSGFRRREFGAEVGSASRQFETLRGTISSVKSQIDQLPAGLQSQFIPAIRRAEQEFTRLAASPNATADSLSRLQQRLDAVQRSSRRASAANELTQGFGGAGSRGLDFGIDQRAVRGIAGEIEFLQGKLSRLSAEARGPVVAALERFRQVAARGLDEGTLGTQQFTRQIGAARQEVVRLAAGVLNVKPGRLADQLKRVGDVARGSFGNTGLAIQQAAFAIEDFFSVTGGLDQRIRAAGNNLSQLGFIVGGTTGLIVGISAAIGAQLVAALIKWSGATQSAEDRQRALEKALEGTNNALERQRDLAAQLADSFRDIARSQRTSGVPEQFRREIESRAQINEFNSRRAERRTALIESTDPATIRASAEITSIDEQLRTEQNAANRRRLLARRARAEEARQLAIDTIEERGRTNFNLFRGQGLVGDAQINRQIEARAQVQARLREAERRNAPQSRIDELGREISVINNVIERLRGLSRNEALIGGQRLSETGQRITQNIQEIPGVSFIGVRLAGLLQSQEELQNALNDAAVSADEFSEQFGRLEIDFKPLEEASIAADRFSRALQDAASQLADAVSQELNQRSLQARRDANSQEARFGEQDPRTELARNDQRRLEEAGRQAEDSRAAIEAERSRLRLQFERDLLEGRGDPQAIALSSRIRQIDQALAVNPRDADDVARQEQLRVEREQRQLELDRLFSQRADVRALQRRADEGDIAAQQQLQRLDDEARGRELLLTPAQLAARELSRQIDQIRAATEENVNQAGRLGRQQEIPGLLQQGADAERRLREQFQQEQAARLRQAAPNIFGLADAVQNAILQGPSRAALQATDVSTVEGSRELSRLLRGDDAARNQDLVTLQREANGLLREIAQGGAQVAN